jgi:microcystin-dependent protein
VDKINTATGASVASLQFGTTQDIHGIAVDPATGKVWVELTEYTGSTRKIVRYDTSLVYEATSPHLGYYQGFTGLDMDIVSGVAYCGLRYTAGNAPYVLAVNLTTFAVTAYTGTPNLGTSGHGFAASTFDFGDGILRFVFTDNVNARVFYLSSGTTLTERPNDNFPLGSDTGPSGTIVATDNLAHFGNEFRQFAHSRLSTPNATTQVFPWKKFTGINWTTETSQWWASYTWRDSDGTTHQTDQGKRAAFTMAKRSRIRLTSAAIPDFGGVDDPNAVSFYLGRNPTDPTRTGMWLHGGTLGDGVTSLDLTAVSFAGTNPPANNDFPGSTPGYIKSGAKRADGTPKVKVDGLGVANVDGLIPPGSVQMWAGVSASPPTGWVFCNGTSTPLNTAVYPDLFAAIGYTYGGSGTTFYPPNFNDKMPIGAGGARALGATGGAETKPVPAHTHTTNLASHTHFAGTYATNSTGSSHDHGNGSLAANTLNDRASGSGGRATATITGRTGTDGSAHTHGFAGESGGVVGANPDMTSSQPSGSAFDIMPPWLALKFIIKL